MELAAYPRWLDRPWQDCDGSVAWTLSSGAIIADVQEIAVGRSIRILAKLEKLYGRGRWRKLKGIAMVELPDGSVAGAELHWYEAHGMGRKDMKIKRLVD